VTTYRYLIVGGGVAGATAAETIRAKEPSASIAVVNNEPYALYSRVMLSKPEFFLGKIPFDKVWLKGTTWYRDHRVDFLGGKKAAGLDPSRKILLLDDGSTVGYEKLLLATGVCVRRWDVAGADKKGVHYLRTLDDGKSIMGAITTAKRAVVIGGGFIGFEMAAILRTAGLETSLLLRESYFWEPTLDEASGRMIEKALTAGGVKIFRRAEAVEVIGDGSVEGVVLKDGTNMECDIIICGIGTSCALEWLQENGIRVNHGIVANEYLETSAHDVWTAGDVAEFNDLILDETTQIGNWVNAREQGRIAGLNMMGAHQPFRFVSFYTTQGMGVTIAFVGDVRVLPGREVIPRGSPESNSYGRLIVLNKGARKEVEGATLINRTMELTAIARLIESNVDVSDKLGALADTNVNLKSLIQSPAPPAS